MTEKIKAIVEKHYEGLAYLFFGGLATLLHLVLYVVFGFVFGYEATNSWANLLNNALCILFAYVTNRTWVFMSKTRGREAWREFVSFVTCRLGTLAMDIVVMFVGGNILGPLLVPDRYLGLWGFGVKLFSNVLVIVFNYVLSKLIIFRKKK